MSRSTKVLLAAAALVTPLALRAQTLDLPPRKTGLWEINMESSGGLPSMTTRMCIDAATDREMMDYALKQTGRDCKTALRREGSTYTIDTDCTVGGAAVKSKTVISGDFKSAYIARIEGTIEGMPGGGKGSQPIRMTQTAKWKSADCPGMKPGDISMLGGIKINIKQMK